MKKEFLGRTSFRSFHCLMIVSFFVSSQPSAVSEKLKTKLTTEFVITFYIVFCSPFLSEAVR